MDWLEPVFTADGSELQPWHAALRAVIIYVVSIMLVRVGKKRFFGEATAFDVVLGVVLGSVIARSINGGADLYGTLAASGVLIAMHWVFSWLAYRVRWFSSLVKGHSNVLVRDGQVLEEELKRHHITMEELLTALRSKGHSEDVSRIGKATLEQSGEVSVVPSHREPRVLEVRVENGVQTIRLELS